VCHGDVYAHNVMADGAGATTLLDYGGPLHWGKSSMGKA
jgi:aminoglycoside phosphotransferase